MIVVDQGEGGEPGTKELLDKVRGDASSILVDGKNVSANSDTAQAASQLDNQLSRDLMEQLCQKVKDAFRESENRKQQWANPLTRPQPGTDYWCHFIINVDTHVGWVDEPTWKKCGFRECPENRYRPKNKRDD